MTEPTRPEDHTARADSDIEVEPLDVEAYVREGKTEELLEALVGGREVNDLDRMLLKCRDDAIGRISYLERLQREDLMRWLLSATGGMKLSQLAKAADLTSKRLKDLLDGKEFPYFYELQRLARAGGKRLQISLVDIDEERDKAELVAAIVARNDDQVDLSRNPQPL